MTVTVVMAGDVEDVMVEGVAKIEVNPDGHLYLSSMVNETIGFFPKGQFIGVYREDS